MQRILSKDNQYLKLVKSLQSKKGREAAGCYLAEGLRLAEEAADAADCAFALFAESALAESRVSALAESLAAKNTPLFLVSDALFAKAAATEHPQGVLAVVRLPENTPIPPGAYLAYADGIADPGNLGTILRNAYALGCAGLLLSPKTADPYNPKAVRASMGALFRLPLYRCSSPEEALAMMEPLGALPLIASADGEDLRYCGELLCRPHIWVLGAEAGGVSRFWQEHAARKVCIPMREGAESLNVASAAAVLFYQSFFAQNPDQKG